MEKHGNAKMPSLKDKLYGQPEPVKAKKPKTVKEEKVEVKSKKK